MLSSEALKKKRAEVYQDSQPNPGIANTAVLRNAATALSAGPRRRIHQLNKNLFTLCAVVKLLEESLVSKYYAVLL